MAAAMLAACSGGSNTPNATSTGGSAGHTSQTLHLTQSAAPGSFELGNWSGAESILSTAVYDPIVGVGLDGKLAPGVAKSWEYNADHTQLTFHIRTGTKFTDGSPVDAQAVVTSIEALRKGPVTSGVWSAVSKVEATDDSTVVLTYSAPYAALLPSLNGPNGAIASPKSVGQASAKQDPVGSGPYVLNKASTVVGSKYVLDRNPDYWNAKAYPFDHVDVTIIADPTASQNALRSGQVDVIAAGIAPDVVATFPKGQFSSGENTPTAVGVIYLADRAGTVVPALANEKVRQAINLAFDRDTIAAKLVGKGSAATNQVVNPKGGAYSKDLEAKTPYDVKKAKQLMADAGYGGGFDVTMPSTVYTTQFESTISQSLADIGIKVTWEPVPFQDFFTKVFQQTYGMFFMYNGLTPAPSMDVSSNLTGLFNPFGTKTPELDALLVKANAADDATSDDAWKAANAYLVDNSWFAPLNSTTGFWVSSKKVVYTPPVQYGVNLLPYAPAAG
ncbi:ABC transporter substrate-binding protein [Cellulomonas sp. McL0617]|uniref:ABC transporter substrate-binding protein n=1 Tax=Cellulomonas sp. McL0617 TaxID=3415675 RepID=UPI003CEFBB3E